MTDGFVFEVESRTHWFEAFLPVFLLLVLYLLRAVTGDLGLAVWLGVVTALFVVAIGWRSFFLAFGIVTVARADDFCTVVERLGPFSRKKSFQWSALRNVIDRARHRGRGVYREVQLVTVAENGKVEFITFGKALSDDARKTLVVAIEQELEKRRAV